MPRFNLLEELAQLHGEESWQRGDRNAKTLLKEPQLRLTIIALKSGARLDQHETDGPVTIHTLRGNLRVTVRGDVTMLAPGQLLALEAGAPHAVEALEESAFLLTIGWPPRVS
jgi:quercetin dioxygenase-like cupin family protein